MHLHRTVNVRLLLLLLLRFRALLLVKGFLLQRLRLLFPFLQWALRVQ